MHSSEEAAKAQGDLISRVKIILDKKDLRLLAASCTSLDKLISIDLKGKSLVKDRAEIERMQNKINSEQVERVKQTGHKYKEIQRQFKLAVELCRLKDPQRRLKLEKRKEIRKNLKQNPPCNPRVLL